MGGRIGVVPGAKKEEEEEDDDEDDDDDRARVGTRDRMGMRGPDFRERGGDREEEEEEEEEGVGVRERWENVGRECRWEATEEAWR